MGSITVSNLAKAYKQYPSHWSRLAEWLAPFSKKRHSLKWILQDINFTINSGEAVGIIGINGAGKSTLLKMIAGTTQPTTGSIEINGHVSALLELGMGFHSEFTGRQNVVMAGQLLGLSIEEISQLMPEIEDFAEIGEYIDMPVRVYSSGMQVRLAFAIATAKRPDIIIVDEALSVGDAAFQRKCFSRIEVFRDKGTTLLFVTHDIETVKRICNKAIFIKEGRIAEYGIAKTVCDEYEKNLFTIKGVQGDLSQNDDEARLGCDESLTIQSGTEYGDGSAIIQQVWLENEQGKAIKVISSGQSFTINYIVEFNDDLEYLIFAIMIKTREGVSIYGTDTSALEYEGFSYSIGSRIQVSFSLQNQLAPGNYYLNCGIRQETNEHRVFIHRHLDVLTFKITPSEQTTVAAGLLEMDAKLHIMDVFNAK